MTSTVTSFVVLVMVVSLALMIPFMSINLFLDNIVVLPGEMSITTVTPFKTRLWASLLGLTFIGFPAGRAVSVDDVAVSYILGSYNDHYILYSTTLILLVGLAAGIITRKPSCGAKVAAVGFLACTWLGAFLTPETLSLSLTDSSLSSVQISNLTSSLMISQLLGGVAAALLAGFMGAIGGSLMWQHENPITPRIAGPAPQLRPDLAMAPPITVEPISQRNGGTSSRWPSCPQCGAKLTYLYDKGHYYCGNCPTSMGISRPQIILERETRRSPERT
jgi:hypothetical protein